jgi:hypothetical protein
MRILITALIITFSASGCSHAKPIAKPEYSEVKRSSNFYEIGFKSDINLDTIFTSEEGEKVVTNRLVCALEDDHDFSVKHSLQRYFRGEISVVSTQPEKSGKFAYVSKGNFYESFDKDTSRKYISDDSLRNILSKSKSLPCKVVMTIYLKDPYYSATMFIPVQDILKELPGS